MTPKGILKGRGITDIGIDLGRPFTYPLMLNGVKIADLKPAILKIQRYAIVPKKMNRKQSLWYLNNRNKLIIK